MMQKVIFSNDVSGELRRIVDGLNPGRVFVVTDSNTAVLNPLPEAIPISIAAGDTNKNLEQASVVWDALSRARATRHDLLVNVGGGVVTDLGGFAAATYKRGMPFVNVPTTLLGAVDAAVGGKTGVNFGGYKNQVGVFAPAAAVIISTVYYGSLPTAELLSGYAEMLKHALLDGPAQTAAALATDITAADPDTLLDMLRQSVAVKQRIVAADPTERGLRKALNLGHTVGHALEELALERRQPVPHGYAVAWGLVTAAVLSRMLAGLDSDTLQQVAAYVRSHYPAPAVSCDDYPRLLQLMANDKKNTQAGVITFTLLQAPGAPLTDRTVAADDITAALDITRDLLGV